MIESIPRILWTSLILALISFQFGCLSPVRYGGLNLSEVFEDPRVREMAQSAARGQTERIDRLLDAGVPVNAEGNDGVTALWVAMNSENYRGFQHLLSKGADPNIQTYRRSNVMLIAALSLDPRFLEAAIKAGGNPNLVSDYDGRTPIFAAITGRNEKNIRLLVEKHGVEIDIHHRRFGGSTPLMNTVSAAWWEMTYYLIEQGADPFYGYVNGQSVLEDIDSRPVAKKERKAKWKEKIRDLMREKGYDVPEE